MTSDRNDIMITCRIPRDDVECIDELAAAAVAALVPSTSAECSNSPSRCRPRAPRPCAHRAATGASEHPRERLKMTSRKMLTKHRCPIAMQHKRLARCCCSPTPDQKVVRRDRPMGNELQPGGARAQCDRQAFFRHAGCESRRRERHSLLPASRAQGNEQAKRGSRCSPKRHSNSSAHGNGGTCANNVRVVAVPSRTMRTAMLATVRSGL